MTPDAIPLRDQVTTLRQHLESSREMVRYWRDKALGLDRRAASLEEEGVIYQKGPAPGSFIGLGEGFKLGRYLPAFSSWAPPPDSDTP